MKKDNQKPNTVIIPQIGEIKVDEKMTPQNASKLDFIWVKDTIFSPSAPALAQEIIKLVNQGYRLGQPSANSASKVFVGLYKKV